MIVKALFRRDLLKALAITAGQQDIRYYLNGVCVELYHDRAILMSCDGHRGGIALDKDAQSGVAQAVTFIIPNDLVKQIKPNKSYPVISIAFDTDTQMVTCEDVGSIFSAKAVDGKFPDMRRVAPKNMDKVQQQINVEYIADFAKVAKALGAQPNAVTIDHTSSGSCQVLVLGVPHYVGLVMPLKDQREHAEEKKRPLVRSAEFLLTIPAPMVQEEEVTA